LALAQPRSPGILVPIWLAAGWLANAAMREVAVYPRWVVVFPAVALAAAVGVSRVAERLWRSPTLPALAIVLLLSAAQVHYYFAVHIDRLSAQARAAQPHPDTYDAVLRAVDELPRQTDLWFVTDPIVDVNPPRSLLRLLLDGSDAMRLEATTPAAVAPDRLATIRRERNLAIFVRPDDTRTVARLRARLDLTGPSPSPFPIAADRALVLYFASRSAPPS
jgi:hypothetical protein